jgi:hypothetical protein
MNRRSQTEHIRAAREWLGRAEDSLAQENDVQGDLKLMLAKAELAHVGHCPASRRLIVWGRRTLALLAAAGLAALILWKPDANLSGGEISSEYTSAVSTQLPVESAAPARDIIPEPQPEQTVAAPEPAVNSLPQPLVPDMEPAPEKNNMVKETAPAAPSIEKNVPPDVDKQQLMQSAGKILRQ